MPASAPPQRHLEVVDYDADWPRQFAREAEAIRHALGNRVLDLHHIGSTAVPGLRAKPVIDMLLVVAKVADLDPLAPRLEALGYQARGEFGMAGRRFYLKGREIRTHHVHAFGLGSADIMRHIAFRDYLRAHPGVAREYGELKTRCVLTCRNDIDEYCAGKAPFIRRHEALALQWWAGMEGRPPGGGIDPGTGKTT